MSRFVAWFSLVSDLTEAKKQTVIAIWS